jgi:hypothetical protein
MEVALCKQAWLFSLGKLSIMTACLAVLLSMISVAPFLLAGCAMTPRQDDIGFNRNASFMDAWHTYSHCLSTKEPEAIVSDLHALSRFADTVSTNNRARTFGLLPYSLSPLPSRLAVDPTAMVSACADHGAEVARSLEHPKGSVELLITAVEAQNRLKASAD